MESKLKKPNFGEYKLDIADMGIYVGQIQPSNPKNPATPFPPKDGKPPTYPNYHPDGLGKLVYFTGAIYSGQF